MQLMYYNYEEMNKNKGNCKKYCMLKINVLSLQKIFKI
jgi:hypothetical protein